MMIDNKAMTRRKNEVPPKKKYIKKDKKRLKDLIMMLKFVS